MSNTMTHKRLACAMQKAGMKVENIPRFSFPSQEDKASNAWKATNPKNGMSVEWHTQAGFVPAKDGAAAFWDESNQITTHTTWRSPQTDLMTDCFCDSFYRTIKSSVDALVRG